MNPSAEERPGRRATSASTSAPSSSCRRCSRLDQSILLVWPQIVALVALTVVMFALAYVLFLRQEVRA